MLEIKGFITNLGKYNEGDLVGEWVTFPVSDEELAEVLQRIGINEQYEEFFFTDWESAFRIDLDEYENIETVNELAEQLENWDEDTLKAACEIWGFSDIALQYPEDYHLYSGVDDDEALGYYFADTLGYVDFDNNDVLERYFDYEAYGRDCRINSDGGFTTYGYIEYLG